MTQIQKQVNNFIQKNVDIKRAFFNDIVSVRKLSKYIAHELNLESLDAVISAVRRYQLDENLKNNNYDVALKTIRNTKISTKSDIMSIAVEKDSVILSKLPQMFNLINFNKGEALRIIQAEESIKIVVDKKNFNEIKKVIDSNKILKIEEDLAEINLHLDEKAVKTPGIISVIFSELMINDINIMETMSCVPEMILFVKEKDLLKSYSILFELIKGQGI